jgi:hypothetical protein
MLLGSSSSKTSNLRRCCKRFAVEKIRTRAFRFRLAHQTPKPHTHRFAARFRSYEETTQAMRNARSHAAIP